jgi:hypothetical protein
MRSVGDGYITPAETALMRRFARREAMLWLAMLASPALGLALLGQWLAGIAWALGVSFGTKADTRWWRWWPWPRMRAEGAGR